MENPQQIMVLVFAILLVIIFFFIYWLAHKTHHYFFHFIEKIEVPYAHKLGCYLFLCSSITCALVYEVSEILHYFFLLFPSKQPGNETHSAPKFSEFMIAPVAFGIFIFLMIVITSRKGKK